MNCFYAANVGRFWNNTKSLVKKKRFSTLSRQIQQLQSSQISTDNPDIFNRSVIGVGSYLLNGIYYIESGNYFAMAKDKTRSVRIVLYVMTFGFIIRRVWVQN